MFSIKEIVMKNVYQQMREKLKQQPRENFECLGLSKETVDKIYSGEEFNSYDLNQIVECTNIRIKELDEDVKKLINNINNDDNDMAKLILLKDVVEKSDK